MYTMHTKRYHNIFDLANCNDKINDRDAIRDFLEALAKAIDMSIIEGPIVAEGIENNPGFSALVIIDFSHISIHTFTNNKEALIDVFSCKEYDRERVLQVCKEYFSTPETEVRQKEVWWG